MATLFFSYSNKDGALRDELEVHPAMLKREGVSTVCIIGGFSPGICLTLVRE